MMKKFLFAFTLTISTGLFAVPDNLPGNPCLCDPDPEIGCDESLCDFCEPVIDPNTDLATSYFGCVLADTGEDLDQTDEELDSDFDDTSDELDENGILGVIEGTFPDGEEFYVIDGETPYSNEINVLQSWCE